MRKLTRHSYRFLLTLWLLALFGCSQTYDYPLTPLPAQGVILAFGDSLTYGSGVDEAHSYPAILSQLTGREVVNAGIPGEQTPEGLERLPEVLEEYRPQLLILCLGGNDMLRQKSHEEAEHNLQEMVNLSRAAGVEVVLLGVPEPALFGLESAEFYYRLADRLQLPLEAEVIPEVLSDSTLKSDKIHPNAAGYRMMAEAIYAKLQRNGAL